MARTASAGSSHRRRPIVWRNAAFLLVSPLLAAVAVPWYAVTVGVTRVETMPPELVLGQLDAVLGDMPPAAAKTGALGNAEVLRAIAERARTFAFPLVVDPVMISKHGARLLPEDAGVLLATELLASATLVTPNLPPGPHA